MLAARGSRPQHGGGELHVPPAAVNRRSGGDNHHQDQQIVVYLRRLLVDLPNVEPPKAHPDGGSLDDHLHLAGPDGREVHVVAFDESAKHGDE
jgi:hypothetical protein